MVISRQPTVRYQKGEKTLTKKIYPFILALNTGKPLVLPDYQDTSGSAFIG